MGLTASERAGGCGGLLNQLRFIQQIDSGGAHFNGSGVKGPFELGSFRKSQIGLKVYRLCVVVRRHDGQRFLANLSAFSNLSSYTRRREIAS